MRQGGSLSGHERNCLFLNTQGHPFATASAVTGFDFADDARGVLTVDWDADGDLDVWLSNRTAPRVRFLRNEQPNPRSVSLLLKGRTCNRDAVGARVRLFAADDSPPITKTVRAGEGYLSQSSKHLVFGLGSRSGAKRVEITWPSGDRQTIRDLDTGRYLVWQGDDATRLPVRSKFHESAESTRNAADTPDGRIGLTDPIPAPRLPCQGTGSESTQDALAGDSPTLVNLWASWCRPCLSELAEFRDRYQEIQRAGLRICGCPC